MSRTAHGTLTAATVKTETVDPYTAQISIVNRSQTGEIYFTVDGTTPAVGAAGTYVCLGTRVVASPLYTASTSVKLISAGALDYSVMGDPQ